MLQFPNAKINLGLQITSKRADGFHNLTSVFYPVNWSDVLEIVPSEKFSFTQTGISIAGNTDDNLCVKVYRHQQAQFDLPTVAIHLHKNIPVGAGLGGGSSDAAFVLKMINETFKLNQSNHKLQDTIRVFGSDCAFFVDNLPVVAFDKGDVFRPTQISLKGKWIVLVYPNLFISTKEAYSGVIPKPAEVNLDELMTADFDSWKKYLKNDFEDSLFPRYPLLKEIKNTLYDNGALYASMSGSGSTLYGIFDEEINLKPLFPETYSLWSGKLA